MTPCPVCESEDREEFVHEEGEDDDFDRYTRLECMSCGYADEWEIVNVRADSRIPRRSGRGDISSPPSQSPARARDT